MSTCDCAYCTILRANGVTSDAEAELIGDIFDTLLANHVLLAEGRAAGFDMSPPRILHIVTQLMGLEERAGGRVH
jgi:hypothetical protein